LKHEPSHALPSGYYPSIWNWLEVYFRKEYYKDIHPKHEAVFAMPISLEEDEVNVFQLHSGPVTTPKAYIAALPNGRFYGDGRGGAVVSHDNKLIYDFSYNGEVNPESHWIFQEKSLPKASLIGKNAAYIHTIPFWHNNYYHWMFDVLARFDLFQRSGLTIDYYIINPRLHHFQYETLQLLGIPEDKIIENRENLHIQADRLLLASQPTMLPFWACQFLQTSLKRQNFIGTKRIYITRSDAAYRKIKNEAEIVSVLKSLGFTVVSLRDLQVKDQIDLFSSAEVIVSPHGAGLTNLVFANPGTKVVELFSPWYVHPLYWILSNRMGLEYYYLIGDGPKMEENYYHNWPSYGGEEDIYIDVQKLEKLLRFIFKEQLFNGNFNCNDGL
jgi:hypothetical protein